MIAYQKMRQRLDAKYYKYKDKYKYQYKTY